MGSWAAGRLCQAGAVSSEACCSPQGSDINFSLNTVLELWSSFSFFFCKIQHIKCVGFDLRLYRSLRNDITMS